MLAIQWRIRTLMAVTSVMMLALSAQAENSDVIENDDDIIKQEMAKESEPQQVAPEAEKVVTETATVSTPAKKTPAAQVSPKQDDKVLLLETDVVVGYGTSKKSSLTGAVTSVDAKALGKSAVMSVDKALQGKAAGVFASQNSGAPGKEMTVRIRGVGSVNSSAPLYVVDGLPMSSISHLSQQDIESISILKDAPSAAIYGSRAANGVILVTTKKGKDGPRVINYDAQFGWQNPWKAPTLMTAAEWKKARHTAEINGGVPEDEMTDFADAGSTDWWDEVINKNAFMQSHAVSVSGGNDKTNYFLSGNYAGQDGIIKGSDYSKLGIRTNMGTKLQDWLSIGYTLGVSNKKTNKADESDEWNSVIGTALTIDPAAPARDSDGNLVSSPYSQVKNPIGVVENTHNRVTNTRVEGSLFGDISIADKVKNHTSFGADYDDQTQKKFIPKYYIGDDDQISTSSILDAFTKSYNWTFENTLSYDNTFGDAHAVKLLAGFTAQEQTNEYTSVIGNETDGNDSTQWYQSSTIGNAFEGSGSKTESSMLSVFGRGSYELLNKYFLTGSVRGDGSSKFAKENRWGVFPSVSGAWRISEEGFMSGANAISTLKLRGGWGMLGNQDIGDYRFVSVTANGQKYPFGTDKLIQDGTAFLTEGNPEIRWEKQTSANVGFDLGFFDDNLSINADLFDKKTTDMLVETKIPASVGLQIPRLENIGEIDNKGIEGVVSFSKTVNNKFSFDLSSNISHYKNEVLALGKDGAPILDGGAFDMGTITRTEVGHSVGEFYGLVTDGLFQNDEDIANYVNADGDMIQPDAQPGDVKYVADADGNLLEDFIGSPHPKFVYGFSANMNYRALDFGFSLQGSQGNKIFNATRFALDNGTASTQLDNRMLDAWDGEGSTNDATTPRLTTDDANGNVRISDRYVEDGSYMRIKSMQLGYTVPSAVSEKMKFSKLRVYVGCDNLFTFTKYSGLDPELGVAEGTGAGEMQNDQITSPNLSIGVDRGTYPQARTVYFGINCTL